MTEKCPLCNEKYESHTLKEHNDEVIKHTQMAFEEFQENNIPIIPNDFEPRSEIRSAVAGQLKAGKFTITVRLRRHFIWSVSVTPAIPIELAKKINDLPNAISGGYHSGKVGKLGSVLRAEGHGGGQDSKNLTVPVGFYHADNLKVVPVLCEELRKVTFHGKKLRLLISATGGDFIWSVDSVEEALYLAHKSTHLVKSKHNPLRKEDLRCFHLQYEKEPNQWYEWTNEIETIYFALLMEENLCEPTDFKMKSNHNTYTY